MRLKRPFFTKKAIFAPKTCNLRPKTKKNSVLGLLFWVAPPLIWWRPLMLSSIPQSPWYMVLWAPTIFKCSKTILLRMKIQFNVIVENAIFSNCCVVCSREPGLTRVMQCLLSLLLRAEFCSDFACSYRIQKCRARISQSIFKISKTSYSTILIYAHF